MVRRQERTFLEDENLRMYQAYIKIIYPLGGLPRVIDDTIYAKNPSSLVSPDALDENRPPRVGKWLKVYRWPESQEEERDIIGLAHDYANLTPQMKRLEVDIERQCNVIYENTKRLRQTLEWGFKIRKLCKNRKRVPESDFRLGKIEEDLGWINTVPLGKHMKRWRWTTFPRQEPERKNIQRRYGQKETQLEEWCDEYKSDGCQTPNWIHDEIVVNNQKLQTALSNYFAKIKIFAMDWEGQNVAWKIILDETRGTIRVQLRESGKQGRDGKTGTAVYQETQHDQSFGDSDEIQSQFTPSICSNHDQNNQNDVYNSGLVTLELNEGIAIVDRVFARAVQPDEQLLQEMKRGSDKLHLVQKTISELEEEGAQGGTYEYETPVVAETQVHAGSDKGPGFRIGSEMFGKGEKALELKFQELYDTTRGVSLKFALGEKGLTGDLISNEWRHIMVDGMLNKLKFCRRSLRS